MAPVKLLTSSLKILTIKKETKRSYYTQIIKEYEENQNLIYLTTNDVLEESENLKSSICKKKSDIEIDERNLIKNKKKSRRKRKWKSTKIHD